ncbi:MAG: EAL domain-containing protein [Phycisphaerae bacterium]|nr:EAL domain-containing protein [Phycisphaerae bacterium]
MNINCFPSSLERSASALAQIRVAVERSGLKMSALVLEVTEHEAISDHNAFAESVREFQQAGVKIAIDDFGAGHSGLNLLAQLQPDYLKLDMFLVRDIQRHGPRQAVVRGILQTCFDLGIDVIAEGVETVAEYHWCRSAGISLYQGYLFAKPGFEALPTAAYPAPR